MPLGSEFLEPTDPQQGTMVVACRGIWIAMVLIAIQTQGSKIADLFGQAAIIIPVIHAGLPSSTKVVEVAIAKAKLPAHAEKQIGIVMVSP